MIECPARNGTCPLAESVSGLTTWKQQADLKFDKAETYQKYLEARLDRTETSTAKLFEELSQVKSAVEEVRQSLKEFKDAHNQREVMDLLEEVRDAIQPIPQQPNNESWFGKVLGNAPWYRNPTILLLLLIWAIPMIVVIEKFGGAEIISLIKLLVGP